MFTAGVSKIGEAYLTIDFCDTCREKAKQLPDFLPRYLTHSVQITPIWMPTD